MKYLLDRKQFLEEGFLSKTLSRAKSHEVRIEDRLGNHSFTDGKGTLHKYGILPDPYSPEKDIAKVIDIFKMEDVIDLNIIDMSHVSTYTDLFQSVFNELVRKYGYTYEFCKTLPLDTSGWVINSECKFFSNMLKGVKKDIGVDTWTVDEKTKITLSSFTGSYYEDKLPVWYTFNPKDFVKVCIGNRGVLKNHKWGVDKVRTKQTGKKCYYVIFNDSVDIPFVPENITIQAITNEYQKNNRVHVNVEQLTTLKDLPPQFENKNRWSRKGDFSLSVILNNITDDEIVIPEGVTYLHFDSKDDITKLPKEINYSISIHSPNQMGHIETVNGSFACCNSTSITTLVGSPNYVSGEFDAHNNGLTDLVGSPEHVGERFTCSCNGRLKSLKGCPRKVDGEFDFYSTGVTNIDDFPEYVGGNVNLSGCTHLENFIGLPEEMNGDLDIGYCNVQSLEGLPKKINGKLIIKNLTVKNQPVTIEDILKVSPDLTFVTDDKYSQTNLIRK